MFMLNDLKLAATQNTARLVKKAREILIQEIEQRSGVVIDEIADGNIIIDTIENISKTQPELLEVLKKYEAPGKEGFIVDIDRDDKRIIIAGADDRGCIFGVGKLLRKSYLKAGSACVIDEFTGISSTPKYEIRGHQYGCRDKQNTCPVWSNEDFERYIRDMLIFGNNSVELIPPRSDDTLFSPVFDNDPLKKMIDWSSIAHDYGMDVWVWYPNMGHDYTQPKTRKEELEEREEVFSALPYVDAILIPTGDPGELRPRSFFEITAEAVNVLHKHHPDAKVFVSPQGFIHLHGDFEAFYEEVAKQPDWLYGLCYAPWNRDDINVMHDKLPEKYKSRIRHYPDITHNMSAQFEVGEWDFAFAMSQGREGYTSRPRAMKNLHNLYAPYTMGSLTYSEGIHDDVNKVVWADQDFDPNMSFEESLQDYVRFFIDPDLTEQLSQLLAAFEDNWVGDIKTNESINRVFQEFTLLEKQVDDDIRNNYRFKMAYLRSISDYQTKLRAIYDSELQKLAENKLQETKTLGADEAIREARNILNRSYSEPIADELTKLMFKLAEELFKTPGCKIKLSSRLYMGQSWIRGAWLDCAHLPLNDHRWYTEHFKKIQLLSDEKEKLEYIEWLLNRTAVPQGGQYLCLGELETFKKHVVRPEAGKNTISSLRSANITYDLYNIVETFHDNKNWHSEFPITINWIKRVTAFYFAPLTVKIDSLDPNCNYKLRVTYPEFVCPDRRLNNGKDVKSAFYINDVLMHHDIKYSVDHDRHPVYEYEIPKSTYSNGEITLNWKTTGPWRSISVSEIWIEKV